MGSIERRVAVVTGASSGIGAATSIRLAREGFGVILGARRMERLVEVSAACDGVASIHPLDVTDPASVASFAAAAGTVDVLVNNAGRAAGFERMGELTDANAIAMWETNVLGLMRVTRALLPKIEASSRGHIVNVGSTAGFETYPGGGGYTSSKHAVRAITRTLRVELLGKPIRITEVNPGLVETEFSVVRFGGDRERAKKPYEGIVPLTAEDVADAIAWAVTRPPHVDIDEIVMRPVAQADATTVARS